MISIFCFSLSALCFAAMLAPKKKRAGSRAGGPAYTYFVGDDAPLPTWQKKAEAPRRSVARVG